jgi:galactose mutarotase-like enzyme
MVSSIRGSTTVLSVEENPNHLHNFPYRREETVSSIHGSTTALSVEENPNHLHNFPYQRESSQVMWFKTTD